MKLPLVVQIKHKIAQKITKIPLKLDFYWQSYSNFDSLGQNFILYLLIILNYVKKNFSYYWFSDTRNRLF